MPQCNAAIERDTIFQFFLLLGQELFQRVPNHDLHDCFRRDSFEIVPIIGFRFLKLLQLSFLDSLDPLQGVKRRSPRCSNNLRVDLKLVGLEAGGGRDRVQDNSLDLSAGLRFTRTTTGAVCAAR